MRMKTIIMTLTNNSNKYKYKDKDKDKDKDTTMMTTRMKRIRDEYKKQVTQSPTD